MTKRLSLLEKQNRKPAIRACVFCHQKHLQCSNERPCKNCMKRNIGDNCKDIERKKVKYLTGENKSRKRPKIVKSESFSTTPGDELSTPGSREIDDILDVPPTKLTTPDTNHPNSMLNTTNDVLNKLLNYPQEDYTSTALNQSSSNNFHSNYLNQEYLMLGDIILQSKPTSPSPSNTSNSEYNNYSPDQLFDSLTQSTSKRKIIQKLKDSRPFISLGFSNQGLDNLNNLSHQTENLLDNNNGNKITSGNKNPIINFKTRYQNNYINPLKTHQIYQSVNDIYNNDIINFEYPNSYHALTHFLKSRFSGVNLSNDVKMQKRDSLLIILKLIASYRPTFISAHKSLLKPQDLLFLEMSFQRCLLDYEKLCQLNSSPTIIWRRTGEIVSITDDLLSLLGYNLSDILSKRTFIMEIMYDDESIINYFQLFKSIAIGNLHSSINTKIKLMKKGEEHNFIEFCSVWTVKRDLFDIPMLIIGQFLPILPAGDGIRMY